MLELYFTPETCALASHIALLDTGVEFRLIPIDFAKEEQKGAAYTAINPKARVPTLVTEQGLLTETPAILAYLAQAYPEAKLAPLDDPFAFAEVQAFNSYLCSTVHVAHAHRMRGHRWADEPEAHEAMRRKVPESVALAFDYIEKHAFRGPYAMGEAYTIADAYLFTMARWMEKDGVDPTRFPKVLAHRTQMLTRPSVARAMTLESKIGPSA